MKNCIKGAILSLALVAGTTMASASGITFTCGSGIAAVSGLCAGFTSVVSSDYATIFNNANASIFIDFNSSAGLGESIQYLNGASYASFYNQLKLDSSGDAVDTAAIANLTSKGEPPQFGGSAVIFSSALGSTLGYSGVTGIVGGTSFASCSAIGGPNCYDAVILLDTPDPVTGLLEGDPFNQSYYYRVGPESASSYDIFGVVEHEVDEVLGTSSCISTNSSSVFFDACGGTFGSAADLFRYNSDGTQSLISAKGGDYFSYDGGVTHVGPPYNNTPGADYADFAGSCLAVQDAFGCLGKVQDIATDGGSEVTILDTLGYNLNRSVTPPPATTPEPSSIALLGSGLVSLAGLVRRRRQARA